MKISIADRNSDLEALVRLFSKNVTDDYISHQELMGHRALGPGKWAPDIADQFRKEIGERLLDPREHFPTQGNWLGTIEAHEDGRLIALALVTVSRDAAVPFGVIEDIVVDSALRGGGHGTRMMNWIADEFRACGLTRAFLESGAGNEHAHHLFEKLGFKQVSIVMMQEL